MQDENNYTAETLHGWENILICHKSPEAGKNHLFFYAETTCCGTGFFCCYCLQHVLSSAVNDANQKNHNGMYRKQAAKSSTDI